MVIFIGGASHTGKTRLAQRLLERYGYPYLSIDHLKMGLIRSGYTTLTPQDDDKLTDYLWPIVREMVKTAIENHQNLIVEGAYIPFDWRKDFSEEYLCQIRDCFLVMSRAYLEQHADLLRQYANVVEQRLEDELDVSQLIQENEQNLAACRQYGCHYLLIDGEYSVDMTL